MQQTSRLRWPGSARPTDLRILAGKTLCNFFFAFGHEIAAVAARVVESAGLRGQRDCGLRHLGCGL